MDTRLFKWVRQQPVFAFYSLAFALTWAGWLPQSAYSHGLFPFDSPLFYILGGVGPLLAAFLVLRVLHGQDAIAKLFDPLLRWRVNPIWYGVALFGYLIIWLAALGLNGEVDVALRQVKPLPALLSLFLVSLVAAIPEEVAWRGFALPRLQTRYNALVASLIVGALWAVWHLPLLLNQGNLMSTYPLLPFFVTVVARAVVYTWLYNNTGASVFIVTLFHAVSNTVGTFVLMEVAVTGLVAVGLVAVFGPARLALGRKRLVGAPNVEWEPFNFIMGPLHDAARRGAAGRTGPDLPSAVEKAATLQCESDMGRAPARGSFT